MIFMTTELSVDEQLNQGSYGAEGNDVRSQNDLFIDRQNDQIPVSHDCFY